MPQNTQCWCPLCSYHSDYIVGDRYQEGKAAIKTAKCQLSACGGSGCEQMMMWKASVKHGNKAVASNIYDGFCFTSSPTRHLWVFVLKVILWGEYELQGIFIEIDMRTSRNVSNIPGVHFQEKIQAVGNVWLHVSVCSRMGCM